MNLDFTPQDITDMTQLIHTGRNAEVIADGLDLFKTFLEASENNSRGIDRTTGFQDEDVQNALFEFFVNHEKLQPEEAITKMDNLSVKTYKRIFKTPEFEKVVDEKIELLLVTDLADQNPKTTEFKKNLVALKIMTTALTAVESIWEGYDSWKTKTSLYFHSQPPQTEIPEWQLMASYGHIVSTMTLFTLVQEEFLTKMEEAGFMSSPEPVLANSEEEFYF